MLTPLNITRAKSVTNKGPEGRAYLENNQEEFVLHWPDQRRGNILAPSLSEIIALYQKIDGTKYLTHLVIPVDEIQIEEGHRVNYRYGRRVKTLAFTGEDNAIRFDHTRLIDLDFTNRGWGSADKLVVIAGSEDIAEYQIDLWNRFRPFFLNDLIDDDRIYSFIDHESSEQADNQTSAQEGQLKLVNHLIRERDRILIRIKKAIALQNQEMFCESCKFSFQDTYDQDYIECHHVVPISEGVRETRLEDLALVCSNCHRMLHRKIGGQYLSIEQLGELIKEQRGTINRTLSGLQDPAMSRC